MKSDINYEKYVKLLRAVASMSRLFSDNSIAYVDSRFVERLFIRSTGATDLSRMDKSFDALLKPNVGVGVKTFLLSSGRAKREKIAEFPKYAKDGEFLNLTPFQLARKVSEFRNKRVMSDANELSISIDSSLYHCLVRTAKGAVVHEEPYQLVDIAEIQPIDKSGNPLSSWPSKNSGLYFTDGRSNYSYSISKNVLLKEFKITANPEFIELKIMDDVFDRIADWFDGDVAKAFKVSDDAGQQLLKVGDAVALKPGVDYVVLPLYSTRGGEKRVPEKSGINQWNAGGRPRKFGETYVPIPTEIHRLCPDFFPSRDVKFLVNLPNGVHGVPSKICQDGNKALMSDPNTILGHWIMKVLRPTLTDTDFERPAKPSDKPFTYGDLVAVEKDSVVVRKIKIGSQFEYGLEFGALDTYEAFLADI
jgi:hypothetical protein